MAWPRGANWFLSRHGQVMSIVSHIQFLWNHDYVFVYSSAQANYLYIVLISNLYEYTLLIPNGWPSQHFTKQIRTVKAQLLCGQIVKYETFQCPLTYCVIGIIVLGLNFIDQLALRGCFSLRRTFSGVKFRLGQPGNTYIFNCLNAKISPLPPGRQECALATVPPWLSWWGTTAMIDSPLTWCLGCLCLSVQHWNNDLMSSHHSKASCVVALFRQACDSHPIWQAFFQVCSL